MNAPTAAAVAVGTSAVTALLRPTAESAASLVTETCGHAVCINREMSALALTVRSIESVLRNAEERQLRDTGVSCWLGELKRVAYDAHDVLDEFATDAAVRAREPEEGEEDASLAERVSGCVFPCIFACPCDPIFRCRMALRIRDVRLRLVEIERQQRLLKLVENAPAATVARPETSHFIEDDFTLIGRDEIKRGIMSKLLDSKEKVQLIPIVGMGGVGKTRLAQDFYNDKDEKFAKIYPRANRRWFSVGSEFVATVFMKKIIEESATSSSDELEILQEKLIKSLSYGKFLFVIDDVWSVRSSSEWDNLRIPLTRARKGGVVIITARDSGVIANTRTVVPVNLLPLSKEYRGLVFERYAFAEREPSEQGVLREIGKQIVQKLKGLPLAEKVVGSSLSNESEESIWRDFLDSEEWKLRNGEDDIMPALKWSYRRLPPHLRQCFTYCSVFPKDHEFDIDMLIQMWMAQGFIQVQQKRLKDVGKEYFNQLRRASLFQLIDGHYMMHDLLHDLAQLVSMEEWCVISNERLMNYESRVTHHLSRYEVGNDNLQRISKSPQKYRRVRTLFYPKYTAPRKFIINVVSKIKCLRVLVISVDYINVQQLDSISELKLLRYLDLSEFASKRLPESLCKLYNLQTLKAHKYTHLPRRIGKMTNLHCLMGTILVSSHKKGIASGCSIGQLRNLKYLSCGKLTIKGLENVCSNDVLDCSINVDDLTFEFSASNHRAKEEEEEEAKHAMEGITPCKNTKHLCIEGYSGFEWPSWIAEINNLNNLVSMTIDRCVKVKVLPLLGEIPSIKKIHISKAVEVKCIGREFYGKGVFPKLEKLDFCNMQGWDKWATISQDEQMLRASSSSSPPSLEFFPSLQELRIWDCDKLTALPDLPVAKKPLKFLDLKDCKELTSLGFVYQELASLERVHIKKCPKLCSLPSSSSIELLFSKLRILTIDNKAFLESVFQCGLPSLEYITISHCEDMLILPPQMASLPSVKELWISNCPLLQSLPSALPVSLEQLVIHESPLLAAQCLEDNGPEWPKIQHIPRKKIQLPNTLDVMPPNIC